MYTPRRGLQAAFAVLVTLVVAFGVNATPSAAAPTVVSIQFDDGWDSQYQAGAILGARGIRGTFYVNTRLVGRAGRVTMAQVRQLAADGHEIGGHTLTHPRLPTLSVGEQRREVCDDRAALLAQGLAMRSFAYPHGANDATTRRIVADCGYTNARTVSGVGSAACATCLGAETIPPLDPFATRTPPGVNETTTLADLQAVVTRAENHDGGWVQIFFHQLCDGCGIYGARVSLLADFVAWLAPRAATGTVVRTAGEVAGGTVAPAVLGPPRTDNLLTNPSLEFDANGDAIPDCWQRAGFGVNTFRWTRTGAARSGSFAERIEITSLTTGDRKLVTTLDSGGTCAPWATPGRAFRISEWYTSDGPVRFVLYTRSTGGSWTYWTKSPYVPASSAWSRASWTTPSLPADANALSGGLTLGQVGTAMLDDVELVELP
jgi:peptidoglycan/xylan/chitin deacetylase (PgdA/CDA1 family)